MLMQPCQILEKKLSCIYAHLFREVIWFTSEKKMNRNFFKNSIKTTLFTKGLSHEKILQIAACNAIVIEFTNEQMLISQETYTKKFLQKQTLFIEHLRTPQVFYLGMNVLSYM